MTEQGISRAQSVVRRLRVASRAPDAVAARLRASKLLDGLSLTPAWLAPAAVVVVRRVRRPAPPGARGPDHFAPPREWQRGLLADIETQIRGAARPARGHVPPDAPCVLFADRAELLACAASDWVGGRAHARWWWQSLLGSVSARALVGLWLRHAEYVPGALEHLAGEGKAAAFVSRLATAEARAVLSGLLSTFGLRELDSVFADADSGASAETTPGQSLSAERTGARARAGVSPPWRELVPECARARLDVAAESLLGVGLSLSRAPSLAGRADFARRAAAWAQRAAAPAAHAGAAGELPDAPRAEKITPPPPDTRARDEARGARRLEGREPTATTADSNRLEQPHARDADDTSRQIQQSDARSERGARRAEDEGREAASERERDGRVEQSGGDEAGRSARASASELPPVDESRAAELIGVGEAASESSAERRGQVAPAALLEAEIETRFGGLFHLVNLALYLELYGDFTRPAEPGLPLPVWDFVALLGRRLAGARVENDPVWALLAGLAGRDAGEEPGAHFDPPDEWRVPPAWIEPFGREAALRWSAASGRLRVAHPAGFLLLDVPLAPAGEVDDENPANEDGPANEDEIGMRLERELRAYAEAGARFDARRVARVGVARGRTSRARWLDRLSAYVVARLSLALGAGGRPEVARLLCERAARVYVTAAHVDVVMRLAALPVAVRFAGLDRDPGWIPAAGRHLAFHFE